MLNRRRPPEPQAARAEMLLEFVTDREAEFSRISRFLHDDVGQVLSAVGLHLDALRRDFGGQAPTLDERAAEIQEILEGVIGRIRDLTYELNPSVVQRTGLPFALDRLVERFRENFPVRVQLEPAARVPALQAEAMFRAAEAVMELAAGTPECTHVDIHLKRRKDEVTLELHANAPVELESETRLPALLAYYYGNRDGVTLIATRTKERDTIISLSCAATD
jgi:signal transduction histidine kinase